MEADAVGAMPPLLPQSCALSGPPRKALPQLARDMPILVVVMCACDMLARSGEVETQLFGTHMQTRARKHMRVSALCQERRRVHSIL